MGDDNEELARLRESFAEFSRWCRRWAIALLVVGVPIFLFDLWRMNV